MSTRIRSRTTPPDAPGLAVSISWRSTASRRSACWYSVAGSDDWLCSVATTAVSSAHTMPALAPGLPERLNGVPAGAPARPAAAGGCGATLLPKLRIHFLEVTAVDKHLAGLAANARRHQPLCFHHVHQAGGAAEPDAHLPLQIRDRGLAGAHDDPRGLVVELVLLELEPADSGL